MEWLESQKVPIGNWAKVFVQWLTDNFFWFFDGLSAVLEAIILALLWLLHLHSLVVAMSLKPSFTKSTRMSQGC